MIARRTTGPRACAPHARTTLPAHPLRGRVHALAAAFLLALAAAGCGGDAPAERSGTEGVASDLLDARADPGAGLSPSVPLAQDRNALLRPGAGDAQASRLTLDQLGWDEGEVDAPVRVVEFSDFGCGYCRTFHLETYPTLMEEYVATGKVLWKYVPMVLGNFGPNATAAALAAECAGEQGYFPAARDSLFATQGEWKQASDPADLFRRIAGNVGADLERWDRCLEEGWQENRVVSGTTLSREVGARGTPTFFIVGYPPIPGAIPLELFQEVLDTVYAVSQREGDGG